MVRKILVVLSLVSLVFVYGCPGGGGGGSDTGASATPSGGEGGETGDSSGASAANEDTTPPRITNRSPSSGAEDVDLNESIVVYISEGVAADSVNSDTFILQKKGDSSLVSGSVSYDQVNRIGTFKPASPLAPETEYQATVKKDVKDLAGNRMTEDDVWGFKTGKESDTTAPQLMNTTPSDGDKDVNLDTVILVNFNEYIKSVSSADFTLMVKNGDSWDSVEGSIGVDGAVVTFTPKAALSKGSEYKASIKNVSDLAGNAYAGPYEWQFSAIFSKEDEDVTPPEVTSTVPENNGEASSLDQDIVISFTEEIVFDANHYELFLVGDNDSETSLGFGASYSDEAVTINPDNSFESGKSYRVKVPVDVEDLAGNTMGKEFVLNFKTAEAAQADTTPPTITETSPLHGAANVGTNEDVIIYMSEAIEPTFELHIYKMNLGVQGDEVVVNNSLGGDSKIITASTGGELQNNTGYKVELSSVFDLAENKMTPDGYAFSFGTEASADTTPPTVLSVGPDPLTAVALNAHLTVEFSEDMDSDTMIVTNFSIKDAADASATEVEKTISYNKVDGKFIAEIIPGEDWTGSTTYRVVVLKGEEDNEGVKDSAGNKMASDYKFEFTTIPLADTVPPSVSGIVPADGATDVSVDTHILISFSEVMSSNPDIMDVKDFEIMKTETEDLVDFTVAYIADSNAAELTPLQPLDAGTAYTVTVWGGGLTDLAGNVLSDTSHFSFTTAAAAADDIPPMVSYHEPYLNDNTNIPIDTSIIIYFTEAMKAETVNDGDFSIKNMKKWDPNTSDFEKVLFTLSYTDDENGNHKAALTPSQSLDVDTTYLVTVGTNMTDLAENNLDPSYSFQFTTTAAPDTVAPTVANTDPGSDTTDVPIDKVITVEFSEEMDAATMVKSYFMLLRYEGSKPYIVNIDIEFDGTNKVSIKPLSNLKNSTKHTIYVNKKVMDLSSNVMAAGYMSSFTTVAQ